MLGSRRFILAMVGIVVLGGLGFYMKQEIGLHISTIVVGVAASNAFEKKDNK